MAYDQDGFITISSGGAIGSGDGSVKSVHHYSTNDTLAVVEAANYFDSAAPFMNAGDTILVTGDVDGTLFTKQYGVASISVANVVVITGAANQTFTSKHVLNVSVALTNGVSGWVVAPIAATIDNIYSVLNGAITTNDAVLTFDIGGTGITDGVLTIANSGSAAGDIDTDAPSAVNTVAAGDLIKCTVSGTPGGSETAEITFDMTPT